MDNRENNSKQYPNPKKSMIDAFKNKVFDNEEEEDDEKEETKTVYCICKSQDTQRFMMYDFIIPFQVFLFFLLFKWL